MVRLFLRAAALAFAMAASPAMTQTDGAQPTGRSLEQLQAELEFHKADAKYHRELWEKLQSETQALRAKVDGLEAPIFAKQVEARQREIDLQSRLYAKYVDAKQREYDFASEMMTVNTYTFQHQYVAAYVVLALVVCIVIAALWFAHIQLMAGLAPARALMRSAQTGAADIPGAAAAPPETGTLPAAPPLVPLGATTIDASFQKVTVTSSVVGVIVLLISLAFLYIYTKEIYTIRVVDPYQPKLQAPFDQTEQGQQRPAGENK
jgi:hypothetical protein